MTPNPYLPDENFVEGVRDWASTVHLLAAQALAEALEKEECERNRKALRLGIFSEYCLAAEQLLSLLYVVRQLEEIDGFCEALVDVRVDAKEFTEIYRKVGCCVKCDELFAFLGIPFDRKRYEAEPKVFDGFLRQLKASLSNRWEDERKLKNTSATLYFNKIKHGLPVLPSPNKENCWWFWKESKDGGLECTDLRISEEFAAGMVGGIEAIQHTITNLCQFVLDYGLIKSDDASEPVHD